MKFTVLISIYYKEKVEYFEQAMKSILDQTLLPNEVLIIEDGILTKELDEIIKKYKKMYPNIIRTYQLERNMGLGNALRKGIEICKNDIIIRMDTDDVCENTRFEKQINIFKNNKDIDVVGTNIMEYDEKMKIALHRRLVPETTEQIRKTIKRKNPFNHMTVAYKKKAIADVGNYEDVPYFEDYFLWCKLYLNKCNFYNIQEDLVKVRTGETMLKRRGGKKYITAIFNFQKHIRKLGIINFYEYITNTAIRVIVAIVPNKIRKEFYHSILRKEKENG